MQVFAVDAEAVREVIEDLVEALDVCGYHKPLQHWEDDNSRLRQWVHSIDDLDEEKEAQQVVEEWKQQLTLLADAIRIAPGVDRPRALACLKQAGLEFLECCTFEE